MPQQRVPATEHLPTTLLNANISSELLHSTDIGDLVLRRVIDMHSAADVLDVDQSGKF